MDHSKHTPLMASEFTEAVLEGATIYGPEDAKIATVAHVHGSGESAKVAMDVGGFLGIGSKRIAVAANQLRFMRDEDGDVHAVTTWTKDQLKAMPEHED